MSGLGNCTCPVCTGQGLEQIPADYSQAVAPQASSQLSSLPQLSSRSSAAAKLYLDFNGNVQANWGGFTNVSTPVYDQDGDATTFSVGELASIDQIWARVAEDYAPFNIDVTTIDPGSQADRVVAHIAIGGNSSDWYGAAAGGVAYVGGFYNSASNVGYVFENNLGNGNAKYVAEAAAHEAGHLFGLTHQATWSGSTLTESYNSGGNGWAPIMGIGYSQERTTWHNGPTSAGPTAYQQDLTILSSASNAFGWRPDDYGNTTGTASVLPISGGSVSFGGLIGNGDQDVWSFTTAGGALNFQLNVATHGPNLDSVLELLNAAGNAVVTANPATLGASIATTVGAGTFYLVARSSGGYGNLGQYTIAGTVPAGSAISQVTQSVSGTAATIGWTTSAAADSQVEYGTTTGYGTASPLDASMVVSHSVNLSGLLAGTTYHYRVKSRDAAGNLLVSGDYTFTTDAVVTQTQTQIIDNTDARFTTTSPWIAYPGQGYGGTVHYTSSGGGSAAQWAATVAPGRYQVAVSWSPYSNRATDAPFTVRDGANPLGTTLVNQELAPSDFTDQGVGWKTLGTFDVTGNNLIVQLGNNANEYVIADAIRIQPVVDLPPSTKQVIDNGDSGFSTLNTWIPYGGQGLQSDVHYIASGTGAVARWSAAVTPGQYRVAITWSPQDNRATDAPFSVLDGAVTRGSLRINQELAPSDFTDQGVAWRSLGTFNITGNQLVVQLGNDANEYVIADGVLIERVGDLPAAIVPSATVPSATVPSATVPSATVPSATVAVGTKIPGAGISKAPAKSTARPAQHPAQEQALDAAARMQQRARDLLFSGHSLRPDLGAVADWLASARTTASSKRTANWRS